MVLSDDKEIDLFIASRIGSLKHIKYHTDQDKNNKKCMENLIEIKSLQKEDAITCMVWSDPEQNEILIGKKNQQIQVYNTQEGCFKKTYVADFGTGHIVGLGRFKRKLITALSSGPVKIWSKKTEQIVDTGGKLDRMKLCYDDPTLFATGGDENDLKIWRIGETNPIFAAKNLPLDWLQLRRPVWVSDITFLPDEGGRLAAVCSRHGYIRLYDTRAQRRPVCSVDTEKMAAICITPSFDQRQVLVGFGRGQLHQVDLRKGRLDKGYKGCVGAVTDIATTQSGMDRVVVSTSLDRQLRVHQYTSKEMLFRQYLTSKLSCVLIQTNNSTPLRNAEIDIKDEVKEEVNDEDEMDVIFDSMETVREKPYKKKTDTELSTPKEKKIKPSTEGSTEIDQSHSIDNEEDTENAIVQLLKSTEKQKRRMEKKKKEKKSKSIFHNA